MSARRLRILYAAPGHALAPTAGTARNVLALAAALAPRAEVALAFRRVPAHAAPGHRVLAIEPTAGPADTRDDVAARGLSPLAHLASLRRLEAFARRWAPAFDVVLEKGWRLSGALAAAFARYGVPGVLVENDARVWAEPVRDLRALLRWTAHLGAARLVRRWARRFPVIAETEELQALLVARRGVDPAQVTVVELGVDHAHFHPRDRAAARAALGFDPTALLLLYVGGLDWYHDLRPPIEALAAVGGAAELHVVGDGVRGEEYRALARRAGARVRFHGPVDHARVPWHIAAADLCLAPYRERAFPGGVLPFATLKVAEYMACARPVASVPSGRLLRLVEPGISGFLLPNAREAWTSLLATLPARDRLDEMGRAAAKAVEGLSWEDTARGYLEVCARAVEEASGR